MSAPDPPRAAGGRWVPAACAGVPILALYADNADQVGVDELLGPLAVAAGCALLAVGLARLVFRDRRLACLAAGWLLALAWLQQPLAAALASPAAAAALLLAALAAGLAALAAADAGRAAPLLDRVAQVFLVVPVATALWNGVAGGAFAAAPAPPEPAAPAAATGELPGPDIYLIILDEFGRADVLREQYGLETGLAEALAELGFRVAERSATNYSATLYAIPTVLNYRYLHDDGEADSGHWKQQSARLLKQNAVMRELRARGYKLVAFDSGHSFTRITQVDQRIEPTPSWTEFQVAVLGMTPWYAAVARIESPYRVHRDRVVSTFARLPEVARDPAATFTYVHVLSPHPPFVFGEDGRDVSPYGRPFSFTDGGIEQTPVPPGQRSQEYIRRYRDQTRYLSGLVADSLRRVLAESERPPVIIVMGDHGPNSTYPRHTPSERLPILNAYYLPDGGDARLYPSISPVNSFRVVLSHYFGMDLPLLPDRHYLTSPTNRFQPEPVDPPAPGAAAP